MLSRNISQQRTMGQSYKQHFFLQYMPSDKLFFSFASLTFYPLKHYVRTVDLITWPLGPGLVSNHVFKQPPGYEYELSGLLG